MKLGLHIVDFNWPGGPDRLGTKLTEIARAAEGYGFDSIAVGDHLWLSPWMFSPAAAPGSPAWESRLS